VKGAEESPNQDELEEFERALMESPSPRTLEGGAAPSQAMEVVGEVGCLNLASLRRNDKYCTTD
jgi:hypothetical protein